MVYLIQTSQAFWIRFTKRQKVIKLRRTKTLRMRNPANRENCTLIKCISASGRALNPLVILKGKIITTDFAINLLKDYMLSMSDPG
jgi:hypothetical protein